MTGYTITPIETQTSNTVSENYSALEERIAKLEEAFNARKSDATDAKPIKTIKQ